jgi:hypothetical protein
LVVHLAALTPLPPETVEPLPRNTKQPPQLWQNLSGLSNKAITYFLQCGLNCNANIFNQKDLTGLRYGVGKTCGWVCNK